jgi:hypothetical protein
MDNISCLVLVDKKPEGVTQTELKEVLESQDGDLKRLKDFKNIKLVWGYLCKVSDYHSYRLTDMDKVILLIDKDDEVYAYEHTSNFYPEDREEKKVVGLMDENAEIETTQRI